MESIFTDSRFAGFNVSTHSTSHMDIVTTCWIQLEQISTSKPTSSILVPNTCAESLLLVERCSTTGPMTKNKSPFFFLLKYFYHEHRHVCEHTSIVCLRVTCFLQLEEMHSPLAANSDCRYQQGWRAFCRGHCSVLHSAWLQHITCQLLI